MKKTILLSAAITAAFFLGSFSSSLSSESDEKKAKVIRPGAFSISLSVKDLTKSKEFYETIGFRVFGGNMNQHYLILKNGTTLIGIFQGMFEGNMLTFNPGWTADAKKMKQFDDVRVIQKTLKAKGYPIMAPEADETSTGPASFVIADPDGNIILFDQHR